MIVLNERISMFSEDCDSVLLDTEGLKERSAGLLEDFHAGRLSLHADRFKRDLSSAQDRINRLFIEAWGAFTNNEELLFSIQMKIGRVQTPVDNIKSAADFLFSFSEFNPTVIHEDFNYIYRSLLEGCRLNDQGDLQKHKILKIKDREFIQKSYSEDIGRKILAMHFYLRDASHVLSAVSARLNRRNVDLIYPRGEMDLLDFMNEMSSYVNIHQIGREILLGLSELHHYQICHNDLKPENIICFFDRGRNGRVENLRLMLDDLEFASFFTNQRILLGGTPKYMPPERFLGEFSDRSDLFSLGVILYLLLNDRFPFNYAVENFPLRRMSAYVQWKEAELIPFEDCICSLSDPDGKIRRLILRILDKDPHLRPSAAEILEEGFFSGAEEN